MKKNDHSFFTCLDFRRVSWLELFFDLVYVVAIMKLSLFLKAHLDPRGVVEAMGMFLLLTWTWVTHTNYTNRFETEHETWFQMTTFVQMFFVMGMALSVPESYASLWLFTLFYVLTRTVQLWCFYRQLDLVRPEHRDIITYIIHSISLATILWVCSLFVSGPFRLLFMLAAFVTDFGFPLFHPTKVNRLPNHLEHLPERYGLFGILVIGEVLISLILSTEGVRTLQLSELLIMFYVFLTCLFFFWSYFELANRQLSRSLGQDIIPFVYGHLPLFFSVLIFSGGVSSSVTSGQIDPLMPLGVALFIASQICLRVLVTRSPLIHHWKGLLIIVLTLMLELPLPGRHWQFPVLLLFLGAYVWSEHDARWRITTRTR